MTYFEDGKTPELTDAVRGRLAGMMASPDVGALIEALYVVANFDPDRMDVLIIASMCLNSDPQRCDEKTIDRLAGWARGRIMDAVSLSMLLDGKLILGFTDDGDLTLAPTKALFDEYEVDTDAP